MMATSQPDYINRNQLHELLTEQVAVVPADELAWWTKHAVDLFPARCGTSWHYVVARCGNQVVLFAHDEDEFGVGTLSSEGLVEDFGLVGDLLDLIRWFKCRAS